RDHAAGDVARAEVPLEPARRDVRAVPDAPPGDPRGDRAARLRAGGGGDAPAPGLDRGRAAERGVQRGRGACRERRGGHVTIGGGDMSSRATAEPSVVRPRGGEKLRLSGRYYRFYPQGDPLGEAHEELELDLDETVFLLVDVYGKGYDPDYAPG